MLIKRMGHAGREELSEIQETLYEGTGGQVPVPQNDVRGVGLGFEFPRNHNNQVFKWLLSPLFQQKTRKLFGLSIK